MSVGSAQEMTLGGREISYVKYSRNPKEDGEVGYKLACAAIRAGFDEETGQEPLREVFEIMGLPCREVSA